METDRHTDRQTDRQTDTHSHTHTLTQDTSKLKRPIFGNLILELPLNRRAQVVVTLNDDPDMPPGFLFDFRWGMDWVRERDHTRSHLSDQTRPDQTTPHHTPHQTKLSACAWYGAERKCKF